MYPTQSSGTPQTPPSTTERGQASPPRGGGGQTGPEAPVKELQTRQGQAAGKTETKRKGATGPISVSGSESWRTTLRSELWISSVSL